MEIAAVKALVELTREPVPDKIKKLYNSDLKFSPDYILPKIGDNRLLLTLSEAVARAAINSGIARRKIASWSEYRENLQCRIERDTHYRHHLHHNNENKVLHKNYKKSMNKLDSL